MTRLCNASANATRSARAPLTVFAIIAATLLTACPHHPEDGTPEQQAEYARALACCETFLARGRALDVCIAQGIHDEGPCAATPGADAGADSAVASPDASRGPEASTPIDAAELPEASTPVDAAELIDAADNSDAAIALDASETGCGPACVSSCEAGTCDAAPCGDLSISPSSCMTCAEECLPGQSCEDGQCQCAAGETVCNGACVDFGTSFSNCGGCNSECASGESCQAGVCVCGAGHLVCNGYCYDITSDPFNCGGCGQTCPTGTGCSAGQCQCQPPFAQCGASCADLDRDTAHCGACDRPCTGGNECRKGQCECPLGTALCGTACVDTRSDAANCGDCDMPCASEQLCFGGQCDCGPDGVCGALPDHCTNGVKDVDESDLDCGGTCQRCANNGVCAAGADCMTGYCARSLHCATQRLAVADCVGRPSGTPCTTGSSNLCNLSRCVGGPSGGGGLERCEVFTTYGSAVCQHASSSSAPCSATCDQDIPYACVPFPAGTPCSVGPGGAGGTGTCDGSGVSCNLSTP